LSVLHRVAEVRLLHDVDAAGEVGKRRAADNLLIHGPLADIDDDQPSATVRSVWWWVAAVLTAGALIWLVLAPVDVAAAGALFVAAAGCGLGAALATRRDRPRRYQLPTDPPFLP